MAQRLNRCWAQMGQTGGTIIEQNKEKTAPHSEIEITKTQLNT